MWRSFLVCQNLRGLTISRQPSCPIGWLKYCHSGNLVGEIAGVIAIARSVEESRKSRAEVICSPTHDGQLGLLSHSVELLYLLL